MQKTNNEPTTELAFLYLNLLSYLARLLSLIAKFYTKLIKFFPTQRELKGLETRY
jgi:hypothetical protein